MKVYLATALILLSGESVVQAKPLHDEIPVIFRGTWAPSLKDCQGDVYNFVVDADSVNYYEANDYLLLGIEFGGHTTKTKGFGSLFNGRFTSRLESNLIGESNIRLEIGNGDKNTMYRYPIGHDGEPIAAREVKDVRCIAA